MKYPRTRALVLILALFATATIAFAQQKELSADKAIAKLESDVPRLMKEANVPGMSVALVRDGKLVWSKPFGVMNAETKVPVTDQTIFEANSLSKPVFAYSVMRLVDEGKIDLDTPIVKYMGVDWHISDDPRMEKITPRLLLSNSSGIVRSSTDPQNKVDFESEPGTKWRYQPIGFDMLAHVVEKITGMKIEDYIKSAVLEPLGMRESSYVWIDKYDTLRVNAHDWSAAPNTKFNKWQRGAACCSLQTNAPDYARFVIGVMSGQLLKKTTWEQMMKPHIKTGEKSPQVSWGLGWGLETTADGKSFWHWGDGGDSKDYVTANLWSKDGVVWFANSENGLSFAREMLEDGLGGDHSGVAFLGYERYDAPSVVLLKSILATDAKTALAAGKSGIDENDMNALGYRLLRVKRLDDAIAVFTQNTVDHPGSGNTWDSLAEAYMTKGDNQMAIKYYEKSLELDPKNDNAVVQLKKLRQ